MKRYAAKLLFQFRVDIEGDPGTMRVCEERILNFQARTPRDALRIAKQRGRRAELSYDNDEGNRVSFEFVGLMDLMSLGREAEADEVWYDIYHRLTPKERRKKILPKESDLLARLRGGGG